ncbi:MAG: RNA polymerase factor sigma-32 [Sphingomonadales bacterium]
MQNGNPQHSDSATQRLIRTAMSLPMLEKKHEFDLARRWRQQGDKEALHELTSAYLRLVISMAGRHRTYGLPVADLIQEGTVGLMQAAERFEPSRDVRFSTYAGWWIRSAIQDFILRNWSIVRTGTTAAHKSLFFKLRRMRAMIDKQVDGPMTVEARIDLAERLSVKVKDVEVMEARLSAADGSLNAPVSDGATGEWQDFLRDDRPTPEDTVLRANDTNKKTAWLYEAMSGLSEREQIIIRKRRLKDSSVTLAALGDDLGISKERVRQIEHQALRKLRVAIARRMNGGSRANPALEPRH